MYNLNKQSTRSQQANYTFEETTQIPYSKPVIDTNHHDASLLLLEKLI